MILNEELLAVQNGEQGEAMRKVLSTLVMYGEAFGAERMVKITGQDKALQRIRAAWSRMCRWGL